MRKEKFFNFDKKGLRGCNIELLPFIRIFPAKKMGGYQDRGMTIHFGWLLWTIMLFFGE